MYAANPGSPTGWPWPLDAVQGWFEGLWISVEEWVYDAAKTVWEWAPQPLKDFATWLGELTLDVWRKILEFFKDPIGALAGAFNSIIVLIREHVGWWDPVNNRFVGGFLGWLWDTLSAMAKVISEAAGWVWDQVSPVIGGIAEGLAGFVDWVWKGLQQIGKWITDTVWGWIDGIARWLTDTFRWLRDEVAEVGGWVVGQVTTALDGGFQIITAGLADALTAIGEAIGGAFKGVVDWFWESLVPAIGRVADFLKEHIFLPIWGGLTWLFDWIVARATDAFNAVAALFKGFSSISPEDAYALAPKVLLAAAGLGLAATGICSVAGIKIMGTGLEVGEIGSYIKDLLSPGMFVGATVGTLIGVGLTIPLRYYYNKLFTPLIPPIVDLIRFVVREVITPDTFYELAAYHGYSKERSEWYWTAHFILPAFDKCVDAYHRGLISKEELDKFIFWHDYSPDPRPGIGKSDLQIMGGLLKTLIPRVDLRYAWELGRLTDEELVEWYERRGYEEDAPLMAEIQMARALVEEIHRVRDEWLRAYIDGYITEETLSANLAEIDIGPARIEYYATYARMRRDREYTKDLLDLYEDSYLKDLDTEPPFEAFVRQELVDPAMAEVFIRRAYVKKYKKPKDVKPEEARVLPLATLKRAFREEIINEPTFRTELTRRGYSPTDIDIIVAIEKERMK